MIAYDKTKLKNTFLIEEAEILLSKKFISETQFQQIKSELPKLKTSQFFIRVGFFLLGCFMISSFSSIIAIMTITISEALMKTQKTEVIPFFICGIFTLVGSEFLARQDYYKHGLNDAFIISAIISFSIATGIITESFSLVCCTSIIVGIWCCVRFVHTTSIVIVFLGLIGLSADLVIKHKILDQAYLPFIGLTLGLAIYFFNRYLSINEKLWLYKNSFRAIKIASLLLIYLSMNYLVVRQLSEILMNLKITNSHDIPLAPLFYITTFAIPIGYIIFGLRKADRIFLNSGLLLFGFSIISIRYYYEIISTETLLTLGGILLFAIAYFSIQKLKNKTIGLIFQPDRGNDSDFIRNAQAFISVLQPTKHQPSTPESPNQFGGGEFSGGGAGEDY